jgi:Mrp family chromosome partitioning ATPase
MEPRINPPFQALRMTALDLAFIKAYENPADVSPGLPVQSHAEQSSAAEPAVDPQAKTTNENVETGTPGVFRPLLEVDRFAWPLGATRLGLAAANPLEGLLDELSAGIDHGRKVVAFTSSRRGDGCTTLLLGVARGLVERDIRVLLVDADLGDPRLARRLGILPETGWQEVFLRGLPLAESVIHAVHDGLALLPLCESSADGTEEQSPCVDASAAVAALCENYDLVLLDVGVVAGRKEENSPPECRLGPWIDLALIVRNVQTTPKAEAERLCADLQAAGIAELGFVENFASGSVNQ